MPDMKTYTANGVTYNIRDSRLETAIEEAVTKAKTDVVNDVKRVLVDDSPEIATVSGESIVIDNSMETALHSLVLYGKSTQDGTPTPDTPVEIVNAGADGNIVVSVNTKNLLPNTANEVTEQNGVTYTKNSDGSIKAVGTTTSETSVIYAVHYSAPIVLPKGTYIVSGISGGSSGSYIMRVIKLGDDGSWIDIVDVYDGEKSFTLDNTSNIFVYYWISSGVTINTTFYPMIRLATNSNSDYEPYKGQSLTIQTPNGLPGIKVSKGGNYTDSNGQQWVCDEVDFGNGVYVQRIDSHTFTGNETIWLYGGAAVAVGMYPDTAGKAVEYGGCCSNLLRGAYDYSSLMDNDNTVASVTNGIAIHFAGLQGHAGSSEDATALCNAHKAKLKELAAAGKPLTVYYQLVNPIETPMSAEELAQFAALHTNLPTTNILNDAGADMKASYYLPCEDFSEYGGSIGDLHMRGKQVKWLGIPVDATDAATKRYVDHAVSKCENPSMIIAEEYRTTEQWNGKPIYAKLIDFGVLPSSSTKSISVLGATSDRVVAIDGFAELNGGTSSSRMIPLSSFSYNGMTVRFEGAALCVETTNANYTSYNAYFTVKYIKN